MENLQFLLVVFMIVVFGTRLNAQDVITVNQYNQLCNVTQDMFVANCYNLKESGKCGREKEKMMYYCPLSCRYCHGPLGNNRVSRPPIPKCLSTKYGCCGDNQTDALGPKQAGCPEKCVDTPNYMCSYIKKIKMCNNDYYYQSLLQRCPLTCGFCQPLAMQKGGCFDVWSAQNCRKFEQLNLCSSLKWGPRLEEKCRKTCKKCLSDAPTLLSVAKECSHNNTCCWDRSEPKNGHCPACADSIRGSFCTSFQDDCGDVNEIKGVQVRLLCSKTCGLCDVPDQCVDDTIYGQYCPMWKDRGECETKPIIMKTYCKKTCGFC